MRAGFALTALLLAGCSDAGTPPAERALRVDIVGDPADPAGPLAAARRAATGAGLIGRDEAGAPVPALAGSWRQTSDGRSLILGLRPATWSDGRPLAASEVVASFKPRRRGLAPLWATLGGGGDGGIKVEAPLPDTVEFRAAVPTPELLRLLALPDGVVTARRGDAVLGAFTVAGQATGNVTLARNPRHFAADRVTIDRLILTGLADPAAAIDRFRRRSADLVVGEGLGGLDAARSLGDRQALRVEPTHGVYGYLANTERGRLKDPRVRRALALAVDREELLARRFRISAIEPALGALPPGLGDDVGGAPDWAAMPLDERRAAAAALLAEAGYTPAKPLVIAALLPPEADHGRVIDLVAADWAPLGVIVTRQRLPRATLAKAVATGDFELAVVERTAPIDAALAFLLPFTCKRARPAYCNPDFDATLAAARAASDPGTRDAGLTLAVGVLNADTPLVALFTPVRWALVAPGVGGWTANRAGLHPLDRLTVTRRPEP